MAGECPGRRFPPAGQKPLGKLSLLVGLAESFSSTPPGDASSRSPTPRSPRSFDYDGAVGLGIVAAMNDGGQVDAHPRVAVAPVTRMPRSTAPTRSVPIPIVGVQRRKEWRLQEEEEEEEEEEEQEEQEMELSESYTCVISNAGGAAVRKRVYLDYGDGGCWGGCWGGCLFETPPPPARPSLLPPAEDFLSRCFRCRKTLHGLDIFMYRGEKAFCSAECRCQQIMSDEQREKCVPDALKAFDCSVSPCSTPLFFAAGVAAA